MELADYNINSDKGRDIANNLKSGESYSAGDGSKWTKGSDGSISVTHNGQTMRGVVGGGTSPGSMSSSSPNSGSMSGSGGSPRNIGGGSYNNNSGSNNDSGNGSGRTFRVGADGRAPSEARAGDFVVTGGGTYRIGNDGKGVAVNRNQTTNNYQGGYANRQPQSNRTVSSAMQPQAMQNSQSSNGSGMYGDYHISSQAGIDKANSMRAGEVWRNPNDGTTWAKNQKGEVWVSHPGGEPLRGIIGGGSGASTGSLNTYSVETDKGKQILRELMDGTRKSADVGNGTTWQIINGVPYATQNGKTMQIVSSILGSANSADTLSPTAIASMIAAGKYDKKLQDASSKSDVYVINFNGKKTYVAADGKPVSTGTRLRTTDENGLPALARLYQDLNGNYFEGVDTNNNRVEVWKPNKDGRAVYDENLSGKGFYIYNDRIYNSQTGQSVRVDEALPEDVLFSYNGNWYDRKGDLTEDVNPLVDKMNIEDKTLNGIIQEFLKQYYDTTDFANYKHMTRDEALGRANETLRAQYDNRLQNTLDGMRTKALNTGFFGQLPTEALYENAAANNEVDLQTAINNLAEELYNNDFNQAYTKFNADRTSQNAALNTLGTAMNAYNSYTAEQRDERQRELSNIMNMINSLYEMQDGIAKNNAKGIPSNGLNDIYNRAVAQLGDMKSMYPNK